MPVLRPSPRTTPPQQHAVRQARVPHERAQHLGARLVGLDRRAHGGDAGRRVHGLPPLRAVPVLRRPQLDVPQERAYAQHGLQLARHDDGDGARLLLRARRGARLRPRPQGDRRRVAAPQRRAVLPPLPQLPGGAAARALGVLLRAGRAAEHGQRVAVLLYGRAGQPPPGDQGRRRPARHPLAQPLPRGRARAPGAWRPPPLPLPPPTTLHARTPRPRSPSSRPRPPSRPSTCSSRSTSFR